MSLSTSGPHTDHSGSMGSRSSTYRPEIDGLRAIAVVAVIINHLNKSWLPGGFLGVDVFFVISGYVITASLQVGAISHWGHSFGSFIGAECNA